LDCSTGKTSSIRPSTFVRFSWVEENQDVEDDDDTKVALHGTVATTPVTIWV
jgi:hypothetical protein